MCPWEGLLLHPPAWGPAKTQLCTGTASLPRPLPYLDPSCATAQPYQRCCSVCYHVWVFLSRQMTQISVPGTCLHSWAGAGGTGSMAPTRCPVCPPPVAAWCPPSLRLPTPPAPLLMPGTARDGFSFLERDLTGPRQAQERPPGEGRARAHTGRQGQTQVCCSKAGHFRLL